MRKLMPGVDRPSPCAAREPLQKMLARWSTRSRQRADSTNVARKRNIVQSLIQKISYRPSTRTLSRSAAGAHRARHCGRSMCHRACTGQDAPGSLPAAARTYLRAVNSPLFRSEPAERRADRSKESILDFAPALRANRRAEEKLEPKTRVGIRGGPVQRAVYSAWYRNNVLSKGTATTRFLLATAATKQMLQRSSPCTKEGAFGQK